MRIYVSLRSGENTLKDFQMVRNSQISVKSLLCCSRSANTYPTPLHSTYREKKKLTKEQLKASFLHHYQDSLETVMQNKKYTILVVCLNLKGQCREIFYCQVFFIKQLLLVPQRQGTLRFLPQLIKQQSFKKQTTLRFMF